MPERVGDRIVVGEAIGIRQIDNGVPTGRNGIPVFIRQSQLIVLRVLAFLQIAFGDDNPVLFADDNRAAQVIRQACLRL